jgi:hypothetical protein
MAQEKIMTSQNFKKKLKDGRVKQNRDKTLDTGGKIS